MVEEKPNQCTNTMSRPNVVAGTFHGAKYCDHCILKNFCGLFSFTVCKGTASVNKVCKVVQWKHLLVTRTSLTSRSGPHGSRESRHVQHAAGYTKKEKWAIEVW